MKMAQVAHFFERVDEAERRTADAIRSMRKRRSNTWEDELAPTLEPEPPTPVDYSAQPAKRSPLMRAWTYWKGRR